MVPGFISKKQQPQASVFNVLNEQMEVVSYDLCAYATIWAVHARLRALTAWPPPSTSQLGLGTVAQLGSDANPPTTTPHPIDDVCFCCIDSLFEYQREQQTFSYLGIIILAAMEDIM